MSTRIQRQRPDLARIALPAEPEGPDVAAIENHLRQVQRLVMQGELAATAVHEISNLLTIVLFNAGLLRERHKEDDPDARHIEPLLHAASLIAALCNQLRNLSRPTEPDRRTLDLVEAARSTFRLLEQIMARQLTFAAPTDGPVLVSADPAHIDQMLVNLVLNARDATDEEFGRIAVRVDRASRGGSYIEIEDNGSGMTPTVRRQLFRTFFSTKPAGQGTGLGLVTVQRLMHGIGGTIEFTSRPGQGTRVRLNFPAAPQAAEEFPAPTAG
ncbi:MAG TPA: HAMP domain-containing sensor histidine kinase [Lacunisphaera sp.]|nr:HAMP domain-containing sensor histidine kinase [Lacunisphaera sp.]